MASKWASFHDESDDKQAQSPSADQAVRPDSIRFQGKTVSDSDRIESLTRVDKGLAALDKLIHAGKESEDNAAAGGIIQECRDAVANHNAYAAEATQSLAADVAPAAPGIGMGSSASPDEEEEQN